MPEFLYASGHGVALESLIPFDPQPMSPGMQTVQRNQSASGLVHEIGLWIPLVWGVFEAEEDYQTILTNAGINVLGTYTNQGTIYVPNFQWVWGRYNCTFVRPQVGQNIRWDNFSLGGATLICKNLEAL